MALPSFTVFGSHHGNLCLTSQELMDSSTSGALEGQTITVYLYLKQLKGVQVALNQKEPALLNRNARPNVERVARNTIQQLSCETLYVPHYSPGLVLTYYDLFHSLY